MSARVTKLEALLTRVQERTAEPRALVAAPATAELASVEMASVEMASVEMASTEAVPPSDLSEGPAVLSPVDELDDITHVQKIDPVEIDDVELDEPDIPLSGPVSASGSTMDDAIDVAAHQPPVTPPPESGEEFTRPRIPTNVGPTMEQLGETIALEEGGPRDFELDEPILDEPTLDEPTLDQTRLSEPPASYKEAEIPTSPLLSHDHLTVPENAREELERVRLGETTPLEARVSSRPVLSTNVVNLVSSAREFAPKSFLDLLDASLKLK